jgi:hypothetical protein
MARRHGATRIFVRRAMGVQSPAIAGGGRSVGMMGGVCPSRATGSPGARHASFLAGPAGLAAGYPPRAPPPPPLPPPRPPRPLPPPPCRRGQTALPWSLDAQISHWWGKLHGVDEQSRPLLNPLHVRGRAGLSPPPAPPARGAPPPGPNELCMYFTVRMTASLGSANPFLCGTRSANSWSM